jgi:hypothetical protein
MDRRSKAVLYFLTFFGMEQKKESAVVTNGHKAPLLVRACKIPLGLLRWIGTEAFSLLQLFFFEETVGKSNTSTDSEQYLKQNALFKIVMVKEPERAKGKK